jgi:hypothetical protein
VASSRYAFEKRLGGVLKANKGGHLAGQLAHAIGVEQ